MARTYRPASDSIHQGCFSTSLAHGERPEGIKETTPIRRSPRLQQRRAPEQVSQPLTAHDSNSQGAQLRHSITAQPSGNKRKRSCDTDTSDRPVRKQQRTSSHAVGDVNVGDAYKETSDNSDSSDPVDYWRIYQQWPRTYFEPEEAMSSLLAEKKSASTLRRKSSATSMTSSDATPSDQKPRELKSTPYKNTQCKILLEAQGSFMGKYVGEGVSGPIKKSIDLCRGLLETEQEPPQDSLFSDDFFEETCEMIQDRNEAKVIQDISRLIVPSAQSLAVRGAKHLRKLFETVNEGWNQSRPLFTPRPQPDYAVGFKWSTFTADQRNKLKPWLGDIDDRSIFKATCFMYFPFLTCEVKCGAAALDIADRQNTHSATLAVRAVVELLRLVKHEKELNREILAFSVSHDHRSVRIYGHYPVINGKDTNYYRHPIRDFSFMEQDGKEKWTTYTFIKNIYDNWMPDHFERICSAINKIPPDISFDVSELQSSQTGLSQDLESQHLSHSEGSASVAGHGNVSSVGKADNMTPDTSVSQRFKKPRRL